MLLENKFLQLFFYTKFTFYFSDPKLLTVRKISTLSNLLFFSISLFLISACQKEPSADTPPEIKCQIDKTYYFNLLGTIADSLLYTYTGNKLTKISNADGYYTFEYSNDKITKRNYYETGFPGLAGYDIATYNIDGTLATIKSYLDYTGQLSQYSQYDFSYTNGKLIKFDSKEYDYDTNQLELYESTTYSYMGNNITKAILTDYSISGGDVDTYDYSYDSNENYFAKNNALLTDLFFFEDPDGSMLPLLISSNNVINANDGYDDYPVSYKLDSKNNLYEFYTDGRLDSRYLYNCR